MTKLGETFLSVQTIASGVGQWIANGISAGWGLISNALNVLGTNMQNGLASALSTLTSVAAAIGSYDRDRDPAGLERRSAGR